MKLHADNGLFWPRKGSANGRPLTGGQQKKSAGMLAKGAELVFRRRPLVEAVLAVAANFFGAVRQRLRRL